MAHEQQRNFCIKVASRFPRQFEATRVLEIGSYNVNGTVRERFREDCTIVGVDCHEGPGVDVVALGHEYRDPAGFESFDVVCSCEVFEHDPFAALTIANMLRHLKPGGLFFSTCAGVGRPEHGTPRTGTRDGWGPQPEFYRNVTMELMIEWLAISGNALDDGLSMFHVEHEPGPGDLYCYAVKRSAGD